MPGTQLKPTLEQLKQFYPMNQLPEVINNHICKTAIIQTYAPDETVFKRGQDNDYIYYLVEGEVSLDAGILKPELVRPRTSRSRFTLSSKQPHTVTATTLSDSQILRLPVSIYRNISKTIDHLQRDKNEGVELSEDVTEHEIYKTFIDAIHREQLELPIMPDLALKIRRAVDDTDSDSQAISSIIQLDPSLTMRFIDAANSPAFAGISKISSCHDAVTRLGRKTTRQMAISFILGNIFKTDSKVLNKYMHDLWIHSTRVAAISFILAKKTPGLDPDTAMLCGVIHDIGTIPVTSAARHYPQLVQHPLLLEKAVENLRAEVGAMTLRQWHFDEDLVDVALNAENWLYNNEGDVNYIDLIIVAQLHTFIGTPKMNELPPLDLIP
ncbi:MAG: HDOD domain-containing protein, partial [Gammaproteobacteria bacterium]|nr:HDOD domain-containing protein [Gammaproteobacteria bacterium]